MYLFINNLLIINSRSYRYLMLRFWKIVTNSKTNQKTNTPKSDIAKANQNKNQQQQVNIKYKSYGIIKNINTHLPLD